MIINQVQTKLFTLFASTFLSATSPNPNCSRFYFYEFFPASRAASASVSSLLVRSESSNIDRPKVDGRSLLSLYILLKLSNTLDLRFTAHYFYLDLIGLQVINISYLLLDHPFRLAYFSFHNKLFSLDLLCLLVSYRDVITIADRIWM